MLEEVSPSVKHTKQNKRVGEGGKEGKEEEEESEGNNKDNHKAKEETEEFVRDKKGMRLPVGADGSTLWAGLCFCCM